MNLVPLEEVLSFNNPDITARFVKNYGIANDDANILFDDVKRWLWLANKMGSLHLKKSLTVDQPIMVIDEMWHNFILFTREYMEFCQRFFGRYLHHAPFTESEKNRIESINKNISIADKKKNLMDKRRWQYEFIYDQLGEEVFIRWYKKYPKLYTPLVLAEKIHNTEQSRHDEKLVIIKTLDQRQRKSA